MTTPVPSAPLDPFAPFHLDGRVVVLTGASSGLGARFARVLHAAGATVVMAARRLDRLEALAADLPGAEAVACDVGDATSRSDLIDGALDRHGRIDVLINNAGTSVTHRPEDEPLEEWRDVMAVNLEGAFHLAQLCARKDMLVRRSGNIINVASMLGLVSSGRLPQASYSASKGALVNLTRELACFWARKGVRVNSLCPGWFATEITADLIGTEWGDKYILERTPMGRIGGEHELDGALLFLASDASSYVTGSTLVVDGGWTAH